jgi:hypothetical protein
MYLHEMYKNCVEMSRFTINKFLVISCVLGFLLQMNIMLDQDCILMMFFCYTCDYIVVGILHLKFLNLFKCST